jgi:hypothetical protein
MRKYKKRIQAAKSFSYMLKRYKQSLFLFVKEKRESLLVWTASSSQLVPAVVRKPLVVWRWIIGSYWFYISIIIAVILMKTVVPSAVGATLSKVYPQIETRKMFGLIVQKSENPRISLQRAIIIKILWASAFGVNAYVLLLSLPGIVRKANSKAREKEAKAASIIAVKPSESILLYNKALKLAVDQSHESILKSKIDSLDNIIKTGNIQPSPSKPPAYPASQGTGTIVLPKDCCMIPNKPACLDRVGVIELKKSSAMAPWELYFLPKTSCFSGIWR